MKDAKRWEKEKRKWIDLTSSRTNFKQNFEFESPCLKPIDPRVMLKNIYVDTYVYLVYKIWNEYKFSFPKFWYT